LKGRQKMRRRIVAVAVVVLLSSVVDSARGQVRYTITGLGNIGLSATPAAMSTVNGQLEVVGSGNENNSNPAAWYWTNDTGMVDMTPVLSGTTSGYATGVNSSGQIVGYDSAGGFAYTIGGTATSLSLPSGAGGLFGTGTVNSSGGAIATYFVGIWPTPIPVICYVGGGTNTSIGSGVTLGSSGIFGIAINDNGWAAGYGQLVSGTTQDAQGYNGSTWTDLGNFGANSHAQAIDANGDIVGFSSNGTDVLPFYAPRSGTGWGAMVNLGLSDGNTTSRACGINDNGLIVGSENSTAYVWSTTPGSGVALSTLVNNLGGWTLIRATAVDDAGHIVGLGTSPSGQADAFLLTPVPEPSSITLLLASAACLLGYAWRRRTA
jgi:uncharacterized membrane protein